MEPDVVRVRVRLESVEPVLTSRFLEPGMLVQITRGVFKGMMGFIREDPRALEKPFTLVVEEAT